MLQEQVNERQGVKNDEASKERDFGKLSGDPGITPETGTFTLCPQLDCHFILTKWGLFSPYFSSFHVYVWEDVCSHMCAWIYCVYSPVLVYSISFRPYYLRHGLLTNPKAPKFS